MCGIAGILSTDPSVRERLPRALDAIAHRGPDDEGRAEFPGAVLGHRRLSILDLETGRQPIVDPEKRRAIVFNGEIYNFHDLREELSREGYPFRTRSEAEVLLHLYDKMGERCVERLDGMFAFAIWDEPRGRLLLARDPMGQKPLFHLETTAGGAPCFIFASEVKAILATGLHAPRVDLEALYHYVSLRTIPDRLTLFSGIAKLPAGHLLVRERDGTTRITRYWKLAFGPRLEGTDEEILDRLEERLRETVRAHLLADVPVGAFLSCLLYTSDAADEFR
ncbi:MAG: asparagine synthetase B, partial [Candidatus Eisenbacteria bacterium]|nr:asparagine synthetase B [Candidatus Eisenbacteria bacterium]